MGVPEDRPDLEMFLVLGEDEVLDIDQADDVVLVILIHGETCVHGLPEDGEHFLEGGFHVHGDHVDPGHHDVLGQRIGEIEHIVDHLFLLGFDDAALVAHVHIGAELCLGHGGDLLAGVDVQQAQDSVGHFVHHEDYGGHDLHQAVYDAAVGQRDFIRGEHGPGLGDDFAHQQDDEGQDTGSHGHGDAEAQSDGGGQGRGGKVHDVVADQDGAQHLAVAFQYPVDLCGAFDALFLKGAHPDTVHRAESGLCRGKET